MNIKEFRVDNGALRFSDINEVMRVITQYLADRVPNDTTFEDYLLKDFVYPESLGRFTLPLSNNNDDDFGYKKKRKRLATFERHHVSSIIEALIFDYPEQLQKFFTKLKNKEERFFQAFLNALKTKNLYYDEFLNDDVSKLNQAIDDLSAYGEINKNSPEIEAQERGKAAVDLADDLRAKAVNFHKPSNDEPGDEKQNDFPHQNKVILVSRKLGFLHCLHSKDKQFEKHHGWKRVISNIALCLCTGVIPYLIGCTIKWGSTGHFFINDQTTTEEKVEGIHKVIDSQLKLKTH